MNPLALFLEDLAEVICELGDAKLISDPSGEPMFFWTGDADVVQLRVTMKLAAIEADLADSTEESENYTRIYFGLQDLLDSLIP